MSIEIIFVCLFTAVLHFVGTVVYAVRIVGLRTRKFSVAYIFFNFFSILARIATSLQAPLLAKYVEKKIITGQHQSLAVFYIIILFAAFGAFTGGFAIPSFQRFAGLAVDSFYYRRSVIKVLLRLFGGNLLKHIKNSITKPVSENYTRLFNWHGVPSRIMFINMIVSAFSTISVLCCLYAGYLHPELRSTTTAFTGFTTGMALVLSLLFVDPQIALLSDEVFAGNNTEAQFRRFITVVVFTKFMGTLLSLLLLVPMAYIIVWLATAI